MHDCELVGEHRGGAFEERQWGQRLIVGGVAVQIAIIGRCVHEVLRRLAA